MISFFRSVVNGGFMKRKISLPILVLAVFAGTVALLLGAATPVSSINYKTVLPDTPLYAEADVSSEILIKIPQNVVVNPIEGEVFVDGKVWYKVDYTSFTGYIMEESLYPSFSNDDFIVKSVTVIGDGMGKDVEIFDTHVDGAVAVGSVHDGEKVGLICNGIDYGEFSYVEYGGEYYFIRTANITDGLSYNQRIAVIIACGFLVAIVVGVVIVAVVRRRRKIN